MTFDQFISLLSKASCPSSLPKPLQALWCDHKGDWQKAHQIVQNAGGSDNAWIHAYLHRKEGDLSNARYWYRGAGRSEPTDMLDQEWESIVKHLLANGSC
jgi:hypothetical protein